MPVRGNLNAECHQYQCQCIKGHCGGHAARAAGPGRLVPHKHGQPPAGIATIVTVTPGRAMMRLASPGLAVTVTVVWPGPLAFNGHLC
jgi:hypothetical protein